MSLELERQCDKCTGRGMVQAPDWQEWAQRKATETEEFPAGPEPTGPEEWMCSECEGSGKALTEDGRAVAALFHRLLAERDEGNAGRESYREEALARYQRQQDTAMFEAQQRADDAYYEAQKLRARVNDMERKAGW